jgi:UDP-N-acetylmuramyl pentapeptide phosphotransferase/UDP-N-acetylglucosamine-1-phosphate transferase
MTGSVSQVDTRNRSSPQIVIRFWIISLILAMIGLATLKVR